MLTRLFVRNYRAIENLELHLGPKQLLMGLNGTGKTTVFDALSSIRDVLIEGHRCDEILPLDTIPRWLQPATGHTVIQTFGIEVTRDDQNYAYTLSVEQDKHGAQSQIFSETLTENGMPLFSFHQGEVQLFGDDHSKATTYLSEGSRSSMGSVPSGSGNEKMTWFKNRVRGIHCLSIDAPRMSGRSERENAAPARDLSNFASWFRRALVSNASAGADYISDLKNIISGLDSLDLRELGQGVMVLEAAFKNLNYDPTMAPRTLNKNYRINFSELSDGQRSLTGLYALLHFLLGDDMTLCIDEPDNFVALAEIQPWLFGVLDRVDDKNAQVIIASHHPELLNLLADEHGIVLGRENAGPITARLYESETDTMLLPAELVARGWTNV